MSRPNPGDPAPSFRMSSDEGDEVSNTTLAGRRFVLYFYPKDDTPGCTTQACGLRDGWERVEATGVTLYGVSPDSVESHQRFRGKYSLPYPLLADLDHQAADAFGVWVEKSRMGRTSMGVERTTFVVGADGAVERVIPNVKPDQHLDQLLDVLAEL